MRTSTGRRLAAVATFALGATLLPITAAEASDVGGTISRQEAHDRAQFWVDQHVPYSQSAYYRDPQGRTYRQDCSGYVSMAWHLPDSATTASLLNYADRLGSLDDLQQGDAIDRTGANVPWDTQHVVLFDHWVDDSHQKAWVYSEPQPTEFAEYTTYTRSYMTNNGYIPIRYRNIAASLDPANVPDGTVFREASGTIAVASGGAPFRFGNMDEYHQAGYADGQWTNVPAGFADRMPQTPRPGTVLRNPAGGGLYVVAGGAKLLFTSMDDFHNAGHGDSGWINVPGSALDRLPNTPANGTLLRNNVSGAVYVFAGGAKLQFSSMDELTQAGYGAGWVNAPTDYLASLGSAPTSPVILRTASDGAIYAVTGGAKFRFSSPDDFHNAGYGDGAWVSAPTAPVAALGSVPADRSLVRDPANGAIYVMAGGAKQYFDSWDEYLALGYRENTWVNLPGGVASSFGNTPKDGSVLRGADGKVYVVAGGALFWFKTGEEYAAAGHTDNDWVNVSASALSHLAGAPADGTLLKQTGNPQIWKVVGGKRTPVASGTAVTVSPSALAGIPLA
ncbi:hypothetical protein ACWED2_25565 [Amycolatopsis sp. NPDC005003]